VRFYVKPPIGTEVTLTDDYVHVVNVLRRKIGDTLTVFCGDGYNYTAEITAISRGGAVCRVLERRDGIPPLRVAVTLYQALLKPDRFEEVVTKASELGVASVVPVVTARTQHPVGAYAYDRLHKVAVAAAKQCERGDLLKVQPPVALADALARMSAGALALMPYESETDGSLQGVLSASRGAREASVLVGPAGGFSAEEVAAARAAGIRTVSLGSHIMRAETAATAACAAVLYGLGAWEAV
jgi:16S rRNA (uracil1498-N3)-methyltransferase